jgi:hypothetical protein
MKLIELSKHEVSFLIRGSFAIINVDGPIIYEVYTKTERLLISPITEEIRDKVKVSIHSICYF